MPAAQFVWCSVNDYYVQGIMMGERIKTHLSGGQNKRVVDLYIHHSLYQYITSKCAFVCRLYHPLDMWMDSCELQQCQTMQMTDSVVRVIHGVRYLL